MAGRFDQLTDWFATTRTALLLLWALYLIPRALLILLDVQPWSDAAYYFERASELAAGQGYSSPEGQPTAFWPPGWPMALSLAFKAFGASVAVVGLLNLLFAGFSAVLLLLLARRITGSQLAARLALLLLALYPNNAAYVPLALTEVFYTTLLLAICWLLVEQRSWLWLLGAGLLLGVATLVKAQTLVVVPLVLGIALLRAPRFWAAVPGTIAKGLALGAFAALVVAPWSLRNERVLGEFVLVSTNGGVTLATGNNPSATGGYVDNDPAFLALKARKGALDELQFDVAAKQLGTDWIKANPGKFVALMPVKFVKLWGPDGEAIWNYQKGAASYAAHSGLYKAVRWANQAWYWMLLGLFGLAGLVQLRRRWRSDASLFDWWLLPYGIAAYPTAICLVFSGQTRFHYPAMPFIAISAGWLLAEWLKRRQGPVVEP
jgi:4-amino-4-deoxy-L-arabinose transferase-like glycosyltransferase